LTFAIFFGSIGKCGGAFYWDNPSLGVGQVSLLKYGKSLTFYKGKQSVTEFSGKGCPFAPTMRNFSLCLGKKGKQSVTEFSGKSLTLLEKIKKLELPSALTSVQRMHKCLALAGCKIGDILGILGQITAPSARSLMPL